MNSEISSLFHQVRELILSARKTASRGVDALQALTNFEIGRRIVKHDQNGAERAEYGKETLKELSKRLTREFGRGFSRTNLAYMRKFFLIYRDRLPEKSRTPSGKLGTAEKSQMASGKLGTAEKSQTTSGKLEAVEKSRAEIDTSNLTMSMSARRCGTSW